MSLIIAAALILRHTRELFRNFRRPHQLPRLLYISTVANFIPLCRRGFLAVIATVVACYMNEPTFPVGG